jgi:hypothetical protein
MGAASALTIGRCCRQVPMAISTLSAASEAPTISPETVPHSQRRCFKRNRGLGPLAVTVLRIPFARRGLRRRVIGSGPFSSLSKKVAPVI